MAALLWLLVVLACVALEIHSNAFIALFVGLGAFVALLTTLVGAPLLLATAVWVVVTLGTLWLVRPWAMRTLRRTGQHTDLSAPSPSSMTNLRGVVEVSVGDEQHPGRVRVQGESWRAVTDWPETLASGTPIVVRKTLGTTLWVEPA